MANDRRQYEKAVDKWSSFHIDGTYSVPPEEGIVAILSSNYPYNLMRNCEEGDEDYYSIAISDDEQDWENFNQEAAEIGQRLGWIGINSEVIIDASIDDVVEVIKDPYVSDLIFIGHGSLAGIFIEGADKDFLDWRQASKHSAHLKLGTITQRQCGIMPRDLNPPLGMFLVSDMESVRAARGIIFEPKGVECPNNQQITSVFNFDAPPSYQWLKSNFVKKTK